jgi:hypothetical protein
MSDSAKPGYRGHETDGKFEPPYAKSAVPKAKKTKPQIASTIGYRLDIGNWQFRQRPRSFNHAKTGTLSHMRIVVMHFGQCEDPSSVSPIGSR